MGIGDVDGDEVARGEQDELPPSGLGRSGLLRSHDRNQAQQRDERPDDGHPAARDARNGY